MPSGDGISIKSVSEKKHVLRWRQNGHNKSTTIVGTLDRAREIKNMTLARIGKTAFKEDTFKKLSYDYLVYCEHQKSYHDKELIMSRLVDKFGEDLLATFDTRKLETYQTELLKDKKPATVNRYFSVLKHMFKKANDWEMVGDDVLKKIHKVQMKKEYNRRLRYLTRDQANKLLEACQNSLAKKYLYPIVVVALNTGMRKGEITSLKWSQIDMMNGYILLEDTKNGERREVPMNDTVKELFQGMVRPIKDSTRVFTKNLGKKSFVTATRKAGIVDFHFHDLRHTFASWLAMAGCDLNTLKELLGHKSITMTMRYAHLSGEHKKTAVKMLDGMKFAEAENNS